MPTQDHHHQPEPVKSAVVYFPYFGWIPALGFLLVEREHALRVHAATSLVLHVIVLAVYWVVLPILRMTVVVAPFVPFISGIVSLGFLALLLWLSVCAYEKKRVKLPLVDAIVRKIVN